eukprot:c15547_g1_i1.p1 GENE.c15547_g1_i1~~c15547_g1_i1.p1  ORF type:complete len:335 (+),score=96.37 c15547_g1_i1:45-1007(+)
MNHHEGGPLVLVIAIMTSLFLLSLYLGHKHDLKTQHSDWSFSRGAVFVVPWNLRKPQLILPLFRSAAFVYCGSILLGHSLWFESSELPGYYSWFTVWTYTLLVFYFFLSSVISIHDLGLFFKRLSMTTPNHYISKLYREPCTDRLRLFMFILFQVCFVSVLLVDTVTWLVLFPAAKATNDKAMLSNLINFVSYNQHGTNLLFIGADFALNGVVVQLWHFRFMLTYVYAYSVFAWSSHVIGGWEYKYFFLNTDKYSSVLAYLGLFGVSLGFWWIAVLVSRKKVRAMEQAQTRMVSEASMMQQLQGDTEIQSSTIANNTSHP